MKNRDYVTTFRMYVALKMHFNPKSDYSYTHYDNFKKLTAHNLRKRKDLKYFVKFTQKYYDERFDYLTSMFLMNNDMWIGDMFSDKCKSYHLERMGKINQLNYVIESEVNEVILFHDTLLPLLENDDNIPQLYKLKYVSLETMAAINKVHNYTDTDTMNPLWNIKRHLINNYSKLLSVDNDILDYIGGVM